MIDQSWHWEYKPELPLQQVERAGRTCYKSEDKITNDSAERFVRMLVKLKHETVIEHVVASVRFITNRGVTHELVRHRLCSFSQESTRYVRYQDVEFIKPIWWEDPNYPASSKELWVQSMQAAEIHYAQLLQNGDKPEQARDVLPNALKTEIVVTANLREWRHIFTLRCAREAHPQIRALMRDCLHGFHEAIPVVFEDLAERF
ncbi:MAG: FAD-dependent thymidylate synthase [Gammaproteobacteria bacterium]|nr:FAD-dependent thymidylate synthase [Gammaproteobacteria bacterium]